MNKTINVEVRNKIAVQTNDTVYVCGNDDFIIVFDFDEEWAEFTHKTARFVYNGTFVDIVFEGNQCAVPVMSNTYKFYVGVYAGDLRTTTPAYVSATKSILCGMESPAAPPDSVYNQIMDMLNKLSARVQALEEGGGGNGTGSDDSSATSVLGVAMLGSMKLG